MGTIFHVQRFSVNDGPGIRTAVFLKGCPLHCLWCHNPESLSRAPSLFYSANACLHCGRCVERCPQGLHSLGADGRHVFRREGCLACGDCTAPTCPALEQMGKEQTAAEIMQIVLRDRMFYESSGGGMTLSGGEPMLQLDFTMELLRLARENGIHTCMETCGFASPEHFRAVQPYVDLFLYDCKESDPERHRAFTGVSNELILENLQMLDRLGARTVLRCPIVVHYNARDEHFAAIAALANRLQNITRIDFEPYHTLGDSKRKQMGMSPAIPDAETPTDEQLRTWIAYTQSLTGIPVCRG